MSNRLPQNYQLWMLRLATMPREKLLWHQTTSQRETG
jgi:hypothetical protein